jgi:hypothetical protein
VDSTSPCAIVRFVVAGELPVLASCASREEDVTRDDESGPQTNVSTKRALDPAFVDRDQGVPHLSPDHVQDLRAASTSIAASSPDAEVPGHDDRFAAGT